MYITTDHNILLALAGFVMIIVELFLGAATGFELFVLGVIFILGGGVGYFTGSFTLAAIISAICSVVYVLVGRKFLRQSLSISTHKTNVESIIGRKAEVVKLISPRKPGNIVIDGESWRAQADSKIEVGAEVVIESVSGVTVKVTPV